MLTRQSEATARPEVHRPPMKRAILHTLRERLTTLCDQLKALSEDGEVASVRGESGEVLYRACELDSCHHLVCGSCGRAVGVDLPDIEDCARSLARSHGFSDVRHVVEISGSCAS